MFGPDSSELDAFILLTREAREERQCERVRDIAATQIQAYFRGWLVRTDVKKKIRNTFDEAFNTSRLSDLKDLPPALELFNVASKFIKGYEQRNDAKRFELYTRYLLASMDSNNLQKSYVICAMNKDVTAQWIQHMKEVLVAACGLLESLHPEVNTDNRLVSLYLHLLLTFTATNTWRLLQQDHLIPLRPTFNKMASNIMNGLVAKGLYRTLQVCLIHGLCRDKPALRGPALTTIITLELRPYIGSELSNHVLSLITIHLLSVPALIHHLVTVAPDSLRMLYTNKIFEKVVQFIYEKQNLKIVCNSLDGRYSLCLLANLIHLAYIERETALPSTALLSFSFVVSQLLTKCGEYVSTNQSRLTQWHPLLGWFTQPLDPHLNDTFPLVRTQIQLLWSGPMMKVVFSPLIGFTQKRANGCEGAAATTSKDAKSNTGIGNLFKKVFESGILSARGIGAASDSSNKIVPKLGSNEVTKICHICSMYQMATTTLSQMRMDILTGICYRSDLLQTLWVVLQTVGLKSFANLLSVTIKATAPEFNFLILVFDSTTQLLSVLDDIEMYEKQIPFTLDDFKSMSTFVNHLAYRMLKGSLIDISNVNTCPLLTSTHTLLKLLYRRNARRQFVPEKHWYITDSQVLSLMSDLEKGKQLAQVLIQNIPHILTHHDRVRLFHRYIKKDRNILASQNSLHNATTIITVKRNRLLEDGYRQLASVTPNAIKGIIRVRFINSQGLDEAGIDQDGVFKEFLEETLRCVFNPGLNLFRLTSEERLYPSPSSSISENHLQLFEFTGKMLAKAVYEGILVDCPFASFFLSQVIGEQQTALYSFIDELPSLDPQLYKNLTYVKHYDGDVSDLGLTFCYDEDYLGEVVSTELRPGGRTIAVTSENRIAYVHLMAHYKLHTQIKSQVKAFVTGFRSIINQEWLWLFSAPELQRLISGDNDTIDLSDLRQNTNYYGGFHDKHRVVVWLWDVLKNDFNEAERGLFLKFVTSCSKSPLHGFLNLEPVFSIRCVEVNDDEDMGDTIGSVIRGFFAIHKRDPVNRLPTSSTCFNLLKLPNYKKKATLRQKLLYAIHSNTGFELS